VLEAKGDSNLIRIKSFICKIDIVFTHLHTSLRKFQFISANVYLNRYFALSIFTYFMVRFMIHLTMRYEMIRYWRICLKNYILRSLFS